MTSERAARHPERPVAARPAQHWWWVRHAPSLAPGFCGVTDAEADLSDKDGLRRLSAALPHRATLVTSDLARARMTAAAIRRSRWSPPTETPALREQDFGDWEGCGPGWLERIEPARYRAVFSDPAHTPPPGGESASDVFARVAAFLQGPGAALAGEVVAVAHAGVIRGALAAALDLSPEAALRLVIEPLSVTAISYTPPADGWAGGWAVGCVNARM